MSISLFFSRISSFNRQISSRDDNEENPHDLIGKKNVENVCVHRHLKINHKVINLI